MKLKGEMVIELTDTNTGAVETVQETNMITEAGDKNLREQHFRIKDGTYNNNCRVHFFNQLFP